MAEKARLLQLLPVPESGCGDIQMVSDGSDLRVAFEHYSEIDGCDLISTIRFLGVAAFRFHNEMHSAGYFESSYDAVVEVSESRWRRKLHGVEPKQIMGTVSEMRHFAVLFSSNGYLEVVAESFELLPPKRGRLQQ